MSIPNSHDPVNPAPLDDLVATLLNEVVPGWAEDALNRWLYERFLATLAAASDLSEPALIRYLDALITRLRGFGYSPRSRRQYLALYRDIGKQKAANRRAAMQAECAEQEAAGQLPERFVIRERTLPGAGEQRPEAAPPSDFTTSGICDNLNGEFLTNFTLFFDEEIEVLDELETKRVLKGALTVYGRKIPFQIDARDYADNNKLKAAIHEAAGVKAVVHCKIDFLREAINTLNWSPGKHQPRQRVVTTNFGWTADGEAFLVPSGRITANGFEPASSQSGSQVDLKGEELACHLDFLHVANPDEVQSIKWHVVAQLLPLHDRRVTYSLLAAVAVAVLARFAPGFDLFVLWLVGPTGAGKSFLAKLFMNFFGSFPVTSLSRFASWSSTANYLQRQGYFFKDALYLVDDYKPELIYHYQVVRILQNYADRTGRGRLRIDATTNTTRPIRGLLISTGEDVPEHTPSAMARMIVVEVPQPKVKDLLRGQSCVDGSCVYSAVIADFIRHLLAKKRTRSFAKLVNALRKRYYREIAGQQNDSRIAGNFALLAAGFVEIALYLREVWPGWKAELKRFLNQDLVAIRNEMLHIVREQEASEVFWELLSTLIEHGQVVLAAQSGYVPDQDRNKPVIGKIQADDLWFISTGLALAAVNRCLREQGRPELKATPQTLLGQLCRKGRLFNNVGMQLSPDSTDSLSDQQRVGTAPKRGFYTKKSLLGLACAFPQTGHG
jgi:hypothetical protein